MLCVLALPSYPLLRNSTKSGQLQHPQVAVTAVEENHPLTIGRDLPLVFQDLGAQVGQQA